MRYIVSSSIYIVIVMYFLSYNSFLSHIHCAYSYYLPEQNLRLNQLSRADVVVEQAGSIVERPERYLRRG